MGLENRGVCMEEATIEIEVPKRVVEYVEQAKQRGDLELTFPARGER